MRRKPNKSILGYVGLTMVTIMNIIAYSCQPPYGSSIYIIILI